MGRAYNFEVDVKHAAHNFASAASHDSEQVHHIVPIEIAKKYSIPKEIITDLVNAIALDRKSHAWIHGVIDLNSAELEKLFSKNGNGHKPHIKLSLIEKMIEKENSFEWTGFTEADYRFLAISYLGVSKEYFESKNGNNGNQDDGGVDWSALTEEDCLDLALEYLGFDEELFFSCCAQFYLRIIPSVVHSWTH